MLVASVIPLAMLFAVIMMNTFGVSGNLMSLGALDFGLIVDGAVIIVEAVMHQITHNKKFAGLTRITQQQMDEEVNESADRMMNSAVFGQVIILIVYLPIFTLQGIEGKMFKPMAQTVAFALLGAFILSLTYIPMMSAVFLSKKIKTEPGFSDRIMDKLAKKYRYALERVIGHPKMILMSVLILFGSALYLFTTLGGEFIPALEEGDFAVDTRVLTGSSLTTTIENTTKAAHILKTQFPEVLKVVTKIGSGEVPTDPMPMEASDMMVILKDKKDWTSAKTFPELSKKMGEALEEVPGITAGFQFPVQMRFNELMTGARQDVVCKIFGEDLDTLALYAKKLGVMVNQVEGTKNLYVEAVSGMPQITIHYNRSALAQYGLHISAINKTVNTALAGQSTGMVFEGEKRFELVVRLSGERKKNLEDIRNLLVAAPNGTQIPLYQLAEVKIQDGPKQIQREDAKRRIVVGFNIAGKDVQTIVNELQAKVNQNLKLPTGYYITYGGSFENLNAAKQRLMIAVPVSLLLIFVLLFFAFNSVKDGLLIYSAIPLSAIGGIFFLALRGMPFSISAGIGFIALFGVAVLNGIVLVAEFNRIRKEEQKDIKQAVLEGTQHRLRPVLMTAFVASLGFFPMAISNGAGAEVQRPLATVVIGGLLVATFLTLFVLPVLYLFFENGFKFKMNGKAKLVSVLIPAMLLLNHANVFSQNKIDLKTAQELALANNQNLKTEKLRTQYQTAMIKTAVVLPQTGVQVEAGQINSFYTDTRFNITQSLSLPVVYVRQKTLLQSELSASVLNVAVRENELRRNVAQVFYLFLYQKKKEELLISLDSLYAGFYQRAQQRFEKGESDILEKTMVETQLADIRTQRQQLESDIVLSRLQFQLLLNTQDNLEPELHGNLYNQVAVPDSANIENHPQMRFLSQQQQIAAANIDVEKAKLLPQINVGYNNMSMRGTGADDRTYGSSQRFQSGQIGVGIPIFTGAQKARINSARISQDISRQSYQAGAQMLKSQYLSALTEYRKFLTTVHYYETSGLKNAALITITANQQLAGGSINYLQWVQLINHAASIRSLYLDAVMSLNSKAIELNYYLQN